MPWELDFLVEGAPPSTMLLDTEPSELLCDALARDWVSDHSWEADLDQVKVVWILRDTALAEDDDIVDDGYVIVYVRQR